MSKPTHVTYTDTATLSTYPALYDFRNLTSHYFYPYDGSYDFTRVRHDIFKSNYLDTDLIKEQDTNHPWLQRLTVLDIESFDVFDIDNAEWENWMRDIKKACDMMRTAGVFELRTHLSDSVGRDVGVYGVDIGSGLFQNVWNWHSNQSTGNYAAAYPFYEAISNSMPVAPAQADYLGNSRDICMTSCYTPYSIPAVNSWEMRAFLDYIDQKNRFTKEANPTKKNYTWIQPAYTSESFDPMAVDIWTIIFDHCQASHWVDGVMVFRLPDPWVPAPGWDGVFASVQ